MSLTLFAIGLLALHVSMSQKLNGITADEMNSSSRGKQWVVLVAGSEGWSNYSHQADICHAYQIVRRNGIPKENIITMMFDDIAYNSMNPTPGTIVNKPNGTDVYAGVVIDYKGDDVNSINFLNIISGNKEAMQSIGTGKVVEGGSGDRIFINFVGHGSSKLLHFPKDVLYANRLNNTLNTMYESKSYKQILLYIESSKSGSLFDGILSENIDVLAVTATGPRQMSSGCYCETQSGRYNTCLADLFSATWMEDLDATMLKCSAVKRTIFNNYNIVRTIVNQSDVMVYGDLRIGQEKLSVFIGNRMCENNESSTVMGMSEVTEEKITVSSLDSHERTTQHQSVADDELTDLEKQKSTMEIRLNNEMKVIVDSVFQDIYLKIVEIRPDIKDKIGEMAKPEYLELGLDLDVFSCYRSILNKITENCFSLPRNPYTLDRLTIFASICVVDKQIHEMVGKFVTESCLNVHMIHMF